MNPERANAQSIARFVAFALIAAAVVLRLAPHPWNFAPIGGLAVFGGAVFGPRWGPAVVLVAIAGSDLLIGLHDLVWVTWGSFALIALAASRWMRPDSGVGAVVVAAFGASTGFFLTSIAAVWLQGTLYPRTLDGLVDCYVAAIPFYRNSIAGDLFYCGLLFGAYALAMRAVRSAGWSARTG